MSLPDFSSSLVDFRAMKDHALHVLSDIFTSHPESKILFLDPSLQHSLPYIISGQEIRKQNAFVIFLDPTTDVDQGLPPEPQHIFILRPDVALARSMANIITRRQRQFPQSRFTILFMPHRSLLCEHLLETTGILNMPNVMLGEFPCDLIPCDGDLLTLHQPRLFPKLFIDGDTSLLYTIALSVIRLQVFFGLIPIIKGVGRASHQVAALIHRLTCQFVNASSGHHVDFGSSNLAYNEGSGSERGTFAGFAQTAIGTIPQNTQSLTGLLVASSPAKSNTTGPFPASVHDQQRQQSLASIISPNTPLDQDSGASGGIRSRASNPTDVTPALLDPRIPKVNSAMQNTPIVNGFTQSQITQVVFIDRIADLISPMLLQRTYEGLLDEVYGLQMQMLNYEEGGAPISSETPTPSTSSSNSSASPNKPAAKRIALNNHDVLFNEHRDVNFKVLGNMFHEKTMQIQGTYAERSRLAKGPSGSDDTASLQQYVKKFQTAHSQHLLLPLHLSFADKIKKYLDGQVTQSVTSLERALLIDKDQQAANTWLDKHIACHSPLQIVLREMTLFAAMFGTINPKRSEQLARDILFTYGFCYMPVIVSLQHLGVLSALAQPLDDSTAQRYVIKNTIQSSWVPGMHRGETETQYIQNQLQLQSMRPPILNNALNLHIGVPQTGCAPHVQLLRRPIWEKLSSPLHISFQEDKLQQEYFALHESQQANSSAAVAAAASGAPVEQLNNPNDVTTRMLYREPTDIYFGFSQYYAPLSIRLIEMAAKPRGLALLEEKIGISSLLFPSRLSSAGAAAASTGFFSSNSAPAPQPLTSVLHFVPQQILSTSLNTPGAASASHLASAKQTGGNALTTTISAKVQTPAVFEFRQHVPAAIQNHLPLPDSKFFSYPLLSTSVVPTTKDAIARQSEIDERSSQFLPAVGSGPVGTKTDGTTAPSTSASTATSESSSYASKSTKPVCLVYFIGGVTYAEVAMLRFLSEHPKHRFAYIVATTSMITGSSLMNDLIHHTQQLGQDY